MVEINVLSNDDKKINWILVIHQYRKLSIEKRKINSRDLKYIKINILIFKALY